MIPGIYLRIAVLAVALSLCAWGAGWCYRKGYQASERSWIAKAQESEIRALKAEAERDESARRLAEQTSKELSRSLAKVEIQSQVTIARIIPLLPDVDPQCVLPDGVRDEIQSAVERARASASELR